MKYLIVFFTSFLFITTAEAQHLSQKEVPAVVLNSFLQNFPKARNVEWERKNGDEYKIEFERGILRKDHEVFIAANGKILKHTQELYIYDLPYSLRSVIKQAYPDSKIQKIEMVSNPTSSYFRIDIRYNKEKIRIFMLPNGKIIDKISLK